MALPTLVDVERRAAAAKPTAPALASWGLSPSPACGLPLLFTAGLLAFCFYAPVRQNPRLLSSFLGVGAVLIIWDVLLFLTARHQRRALTLELVLRPQHYVQACAHTSILLYWGWSWRPVYELAFLIVAQLLFAYAFDILLSWSRRDTYTLGFGPFPIILSTNLFLWFRQDWFYFQFLMIAVGFLAKELIRWNKDGRRAHIFNPSSLTLTVFSLGLILTGSSDLTWGKEIAISQFYPPHMYLFLFLVALPGQYLFGVTTMTMAAVVTTYLFGLVYFATTGIYYFFDSYIPIAVFLGMHLLFTDPSTAPRTELGRLIFGSLYGLSTIVLYELLGSFGLPTFYDKLLQVPLLNLLIQLIDRAMRFKALRRFDRGTLGRAFAPRRRNLAYITVWATIFSAMSVAQGVGDEHRGQWVPFWKEACQQDRAYACGYLAQMQTNFCQAGSGWACNELGILEANKEMDLPASIASMQRGCELGFESACANSSGPLSTGAWRTGPPHLEDYPLLLRGSKAPITDPGLSALLARACALGWPDACTTASPHQAGR